MKRLGREPDFLRLWAGQAVSQLGSSISLIGLPLTAVLTLHASPMQMSLMSACGGLSILSFSLFAGAFADRFRRRTVLIAADLSRAILLATIPAAAMLHALSMTQLYVVALLNGIFTVLFDVTYQAYLPMLVGQDQIIDANSRLAAAESGAEIAGPGLTGVLVQTLTAPIAILLDAVSFVISAVSVLLIRKPEAPPDNRPAEPIPRDIAAGLRAAWREPNLNALMKRTANAYFFMGFISSLYVIFAVRELGLSAGTVGGIVSIGGVSSLLGALMAQRISRRFGFGRTLIGAAFLCTLPCLLVPMAHGSVAACVVLLSIAQLFDAAWSIYAIQEISLRQAVTPNAQLGRVNSAMHLLSHGVLPIGALVAGMLASQIGVRGALFIGAVGCILSTAWLVVSPIAHLRELPQPSATPADLPDLLLSTD